MSYHDGGPEFRMLEPVLTDVDNDNSDLPCIECGTNLDEFVPLCWYEYDERVHEDHHVVLCHHCNFPLPKNEDFVMCVNQKHILCLYCLELKLFRIELGRFVAV